MSDLRKLILNDLPISSNQLNRLIATAPHRYKKFYIPKKTPGEMRLVAQPASEVKTLQRWLVNHLKDKLPVHLAAAAYQGGTGIKFNADQHKESRFVLKMDFKDFFYSISENDVRCHFVKYYDQNISKEDLDDFCRILLWSPKNTKDRSLCIGAPSSPFISNSVMFDFDSLLFAFCEKQDVRYTRYADDLTFSTNAENKLSSIFMFVLQLVSKLDYPKLKINISKTVNTSRGRGIKITGVTVTADKKLSLGRERKRVIRSMVNHFLLDHLTKDEVSKLKGLLAFANDIEPEFIKRIKSKYGGDILRKIHMSIAD